jgi:4-hydroxybenzoyl-CoA reductase subunit beta
MMRLPRFRYLGPKTLADAAAALADLGKEAQLVSGGTDLWPNMKRRQQTPKTVIGLRGVMELRARRGDAHSGFDLGAMTTLAALEHDEAIRAAWPALAEAAKLVATPPIRNLGTVGGNLCLDTRCNYYDQNWEWRRAVGFCLKKDGDTCWVAPGSPRCWAVSSSDTAPILCAIGAELSLVSTRGTRRIPVAALFRDDGIAHLAKDDDEILAAIHVPPNDGRTRAVYLKLRRRGSFDFPVLGVAAMARLSSSGAVEEARLVIGGTGSRPHEAPEAANLLVGKKLTEEIIREAALEAAQLARPLDNTDFVMGWRKQMAKEFAARALRQLARA